MKDNFYGDVPAPYPASPGFKRVGASSDAAKIAKPRAPTLRDRALAALSEKPRTADEVAAAIGASILAVRPRMSELRKMNLIEETGERRRNESGVAAEV